MIRSLLAASGLCHVLMTQGVQAQEVPAVSLVIVGDGIVVDVEIDRDAPSPAPAFDTTRPWRQAVRAQPAAPAR